LIAGICVGLLVLTLYISHFAGMNDYSQMQARLIEEPDLAGYEYRDAYLSGKFGHVEREPRVAVI